MNSYFIMHSIYSTFLTVIFIGFLCACGDESKQAEFPQSALIGRWEIDKAWRNGKQTETLTGTYYEFGKNGEMRTNLTPTLVEDEFEYNFSGSEINQKSEPSVDYTVEELNDSLMVFTMIINKFPFRLQLKKSVPPAETEPISTDTL